MDLQHTPDASGDDFPAINALLEIYKHDFHHLAFKSEK